MFASWYQWKYKTALESPGTKTSSQNCMIAAYKKCTALQEMVLWDIRTQDMQDILDRDDLSHAMLEHILKIFRILTNRTGPI